MKLSLSTAEKNDYPQKGLQFSLEQIEVNYYIINIVILKNLKENQLTCALIPIFIPRN